MSYGRKRLTRTCDLLQRETKRFDHCTHLAAIQSRCSNEKNGPSHNSSTRESQDRVLRNTKLFKVQDKQMFGFAKPPWATESNEKSLRSEVTWNTC